MSDLSKGNQLKRLIITIAALCAVSAPAFAQDAPKAWTGEGAITAGTTQGNTRTTDVGAGIKIKHTADQWSQSGEFSADYGKTNGVETKNRLYGAGQVDRIFDEKWSAYGRFSAERDEFSGFETRYFVGLGGGYHAIATETSDWVLQGGPGYKIDKIRARVVSPTVTVPSSSETSLGISAASRFKQKINDTVALSNDTDVLYADTSSQVRNVLSLTADLMGNLSARVSYDVRYETDPPPGFKSTDTAVRFSLVYKIG